GWFSRKMYRERRRSLYDCGDVGATMARVFEQRWIGSDRAQAEALIDATDSSAMADYGTTYRVVEAMRLLPLGLRSIRMFVGVSMLPALAVTLATVPFDRIFRMLARLLFGSAPA